MAVVRTFFIGCAVLLVVGCAGMRSEAPEETQGRTEATKQEQARSPEATASEDDRCEETHPIDLQGRTYTTNDVSGCPKGGLLSGTNGRDKLDGEDGDDEIRGLGAADELWGGFGSDIIYGGPGDDFLTGSTVNEVGHDKSKDVLHGGPGRDSVNGFGGDDVIYGGDGDDVERLWGGGGEDVIRGGDGDDFLDGTFDGGDRDELYCGKGKDQYAADKNDRVSSSCEVKAVMGRA
jgi:hypothetical protein